MIFLEYPKCTTCKKAKKWLEEHEVSFTDRDIKLDNPTADELRTWYTRSDLPLKKFFNTSGNLYKEMAVKDKLDTMTEEEQLALLATDGMLVKRPLIITEEIVLVGFKEQEWKEKLL
jgi:arsenate reductase (glutaredoxin)